PSALAPGASALAGFPVEIEFIENDHIDTDSPLFALQDNLCLSLRSATAALCESQTTGLATPARRRTSTRNSNQRLHGRLGLIFVTIKDIEDTASSNAPQVVTPNLFTIC
ncbi:MAG: hypothetical protein AAF346_22535, partial [Pseudomonadota bacterium]